MSHDQPAATSLLGDPQPEPAERLRLSFSRVDTYRRCPLQYRFSYLDKLPTVPSPHLSWGSTIHAALESWWDRKLPDPPPVDDLLQALYDNWDDTGFADMDRERKLEWYRHARDVLARHHDRFAQSYVPPVACEQWFELPLPDDIEVVGSIDLVVPSEGGLGIVDWKTNRRAKTRREVAGSLQLAIYALAAKHLWGYEPQWVALDFVVPGVRVTVPREEIDTDGAVATICQAAADIRAAHFPPSPSPLCGWCDFRGECPAFEGEGPDVPGLAVTELHRLRRRQQRDAERIEALEEIVSSRLGPDALLEGAPPASRERRPGSLASRVE